MNKIIKLNQKHQSTITGGCVCVHKGLAITPLEFIILATMPLNNIKTQNECERVCCSIKKVCHYSFSGTEHTCKKFIEQENRLKEQQPTLSATAKHIHDMLVSK